MIRKTLTAITMATALGISAGSAVADMQMTDGTITEVRPNNELTVNHGPIPNLDMGAMTMVFKLGKEASAEGLKVGDKIKMHVEEVDGKLTIQHLNKAN